MQFKFANGVRIGQQNDLKWLPLLPGCGTQHPHRALGGTCVLLAAAPTTPPCFRRWRRSSSLHSAHIQRNWIFIRDSEKPAGFSESPFHGRGRGGKRHLQFRPHFNHCSPSVKIAFGALRRACRGKAPPSANADRSAA